MIKKILAAAGAAAIAVTGLTPAASAEVAAAPDCQHGSSYGIVVEKVNLTIGTTVIGRIDLCRDSGYQYWGFVLFNKPATASQYGQAAIVRYDQVAYFSDVDCDSPGGNHKVMPGQTRCWTPKYDGRAGRWNFTAVGSLTSSHTGDVLAAETTMIQR